MEHETAVDDGLRLENSAETTELLDAILGFIQQSRTRVWVKVAWWDATSPAGAELGRALIDARQRGADVRVIMRNDASGLPTIARLRKAGIDVRPSRYLHEKELIADDAYLSHSMNFTTAETERNSQVGHCWSSPEQVSAASARFLDTWEQFAALDRQRGEQAAVAARTVIPVEWLPLLKYSTLNPFQADVAPAILSAEGHVIVVAPTGAGKTVIGELALIRAVKQDRRKGVWLVPARALAGELGGLRERWAKHGIKVEVLTGESNLSSDRLKRADVWIATTEKFESLCRRTSLQDAVAEVACIVVDEIHLIGDPSRGATLEALLARLRFLSDTTRVVGLSATVTNADDLAAWLGAQLLRSTWRPTVLITQLIEFTAKEDSWKEIERAKDERLVELIRDIRDEAATVGESASALVFVGSTKTARAVAARLAGVGAVSSEQVLANECLERGVGFHYRGSPEAAETLRRFNSREVGILVATSGLSTGVNTPARAVVVRDLTLGTSPIEVSQLQQMFGRAGRAGHERDGYAYLLVPDGEKGAWQQRLADGYRVDSKMSGREADAALAEIHLGNIATTTELESWYDTTFAASQSRGSLSGRQVVSTLASAGLISEGDSGDLAITDLGRLTVQLMIDVASAVGIRDGLVTAEPSNAEEAERLVSQAVCAGATTLATRQINPKDWDAQVSATLSAWKVPAEWADFGARFSLATIFDALVAPRPLTELARRDVIEEAPRYFAWVAELGRLGLATWQAIVATDIGERLTAHALLDPKPGRGSGRVLKFLRSLVDPDQAATFMRKTWQRASRFAEPTDFPAQSVQPEVLADRLLRAHQGALRPGVPTCEVLDGILHVTTGVEGAIERSEVSVNGGLATVRAIGSQGNRVTLPIPEGAARSGHVAIEVVAFSRTDAVYGCALVKVEVTGQGPSAREHRMRNARDALDEARDTALVHAGKAPRSMFRKKREQAERDNLLAIANNSGLADVSAALTADLDKLAALWSIREAVEELCPSRGAAADLRTPAAVLRSRIASTQERALVRYALAKEAGMPVNLVQGIDITQLHCVVKLGTTNVILDSELPAGRLTWIGTNATASLTTMPPKPKEPPLEARLRMGWLPDFMENHPRLLGE